MPESELILAAIKALLPDGSLWVPAPGEDLDLLLKAMSENWLEAYNSAVAQGEVRNPLKTGLLEEVEREFGFLQNPGLTEEMRRQQVAAVKYENTDQRNSDDDVQNFLNAAGFDVEIHQNDPAVDPALFAGDILLNAGDILLNGGLYIIKAEYIMQCGGAIAFCGHQDAVCGRFDNLTFIDFEYDLPTDPEAWPFIYFVGGPATRDGNGFLTAIAPADVPLNRKDKFVELILSSKPMFCWAILIINYV